MWKGVIDRYKSSLPVTDRTPIITLNEGNTPLIYSPYLSRCIDVEGAEVYLKYEGLNPTGSFKDRGMTLAISKALEEKSKAVICASTGNTSASAASYSARAKIKCVVLIPKGAIALGKLAQALIHGAQVIAVNANFDDALNLAKEISAKFPIQLVNSINPYRIEGQKTGAFELCEQLAPFQNLKDSQITVSNLRRNDLQITVDTVKNFGTGLSGRAPDFHAIPVGNAGNITAYWKGYKEYKEKNLINSLPKMLGFQAEGAAPIVRKRIIKRPETIATAIRIGNPASWKKAEEARDESGGLIDMVSDSEILDAYKILADKEGIFVEPASAASVAGILKLNKRGFFKNVRKPKIVCVLTGHGLKDPERAIKSIKKPRVIPARLDSVLKEIGF